MSTCSRAKPKLTMGFRRIQRHSYLTRLSLRGQSKPLCTSRIREMRPPLWRPQVYTLLSALMRVQTLINLWMAVGELQGTQLETSSEMRVSNHMHRVQPFLSSVCKQRIVQTPMLQEMVSEMVMDHCCGTDLCIVGPNGSGKSTAARMFALKLGYAVGC